MKMIYTPIIEAIEPVTGFSLADLQSRAKYREIVCARRVFTVLCRERGMTYQAIGDVLKRNYSTLVYYTYSSDPHSGGDPLLSRIYREVEQRLNG